MKPKLVHCLTIRDTLLVYEKPVSSIHAHVLYGLMSLCHLFHNVPILSWFLIKKESQWSYFSKVKLEKLRTPKSKETNIVSLFLCTSTLIFSKDKMHDILFNFF
jgi:hypothetical protein